MTIEDRLRELAATVRVEVSDDVAAKVESRARAQAVRHRAVIATVAIAGAGGAVALARIPSAPSAPDTGLAGSSSPTTPAPTSPAPALDPAREAAVVERCDTYLRAMTNGRESFPAGSSVAAYATDDVGDTALVVSGARYRACHLLGGRADDVDPEWSSATCGTADVKPGGWGWGPTSVANAGKESGPRTDPDGPIRPFWLLHGCASPRVARVEVRTQHGAFDAVVANGMFVGRRDTGISFMPGDPPRPADALDPIPGFGYRAYDAAGQLVTSWPRPTGDGQALSEQYLACAIAKGFHPDFVQVFPEPDGRIGHVKTGREVPAKVHRPCVVEIGGADPRTSSYGN